MPGALEVALGLQVGERAHPSRPRAVLQEDAHVVVRAVEDVPNGQDQCGPRRGEVERESV